MKKINNILLTSKLPIPVGLIERRIYIIRGQEVMLDSDLAELYQVPTKALNQAIKRHLNRFPQDFAFQFNKKELANWRSQIVTSNSENDNAMRSQIVTASKRNIRHVPYAFTEQGVAMLSSVLKSERAVQMNIYIIRAFIQLRKMLAAHHEISRRLKKVEGVQKFHGHILTSMAQDIQKMKNPPKTNAIGFKII